MSKPSETNGAVNIPTRYALIKRAQKILKDIDDYFQEADSFGLSVKEADPDGMMMRMRHGLIAMLEREKRIPSSPLYVSRGSNG